MSKGMDYRNSLSEELSLGPADGWGRSGRLMEGRKLKRQTARKWKTNEERQGGRYTWNIYSLPLLMVLWSCQSYLKKAHRRTEGQVSNRRDPVLSKRNTWWHGRWRLAQTGNLRGTRQIGLLTRDAALHKKCEPQKTSMDQRRTGQNQMEDIMDA